MAQGEPTIAGILQELSTQYHGVVAEREVLDRVLERRPSRAKNPYAGIREKLRYDGPRLGWVRLGGGELIPLWVALTGLRFRVVPSDEEYASGRVAWIKLAPFVASDTNDLRLEDAGGKLLPPQSDYPMALSLGDWFSQVGFTPGDSILMTIRTTQPLLLQLEHEPAGAFRAQDVRAQEHELVEAIAEQLARRRTNMLFPQEAVLPIYARAPWRSGYPGRPWQQLIDADPRLRLVDDLYIADSAFRRPFDQLFGGVEDAQWEAHDEALLQDIIAIQNELRASRREAAEIGLWDGSATRASTATTIFDTSEGTMTTIYEGPIDALHDYSALIDARAAQGDYSDMAEDDEFSLSDLDDEFDEDSFDDELSGIADIEDMQAFLAQNPGLIDATRRLMHALTPDEIAQLQDAKTPDEAQRLLTARLNDLLRRDPELFAPLEINAVQQTHTNGNGHSNGHSPPEILADEDDWEDDELFEDEEWGEDDLFNDEQQSKLQEALERSNELMERFYERLIAQGKSTTTASERTGHLWVYADFLGHYYTRALDTGDYSTLDECLFFFYPRKVINSSPRGVRSICTSIKQFYAFLRTEGIIAGDSFAQAIWRRRDQAMRVVELYDRLASDSPRFGRLFGRLFEPYTA
jgi:hypothetical protein